MSNDSDFFGDVFDDPNDDPLLGGEESSSDPSSSETSDHQGPPSWMSEETNANGETASAEVDEDAGPEQKQIVVDQRKNNKQGLDALNEAVGQGWRLVRISMARPDGEQAASTREAERFVAILEQDNPQSLFDFRAAA
jgi:hypothetical protein